MSAELRALDIRERQTKTTLRHYLTPVRMAVIYKTRELAWKMEKLEPLECCG